MTDIPLPNLDLAFTDFALLALLLTIAYGITAFEAWLTPSGKAAAGIALVDRKSAAAYAFFGIFSTLVAGIFAGTQKGDFLCLLVPIVFIAHWGYFHYRTTKNLVDIQVIVDHLNKSILDETRIAIIGAGEGGLAVSDLYPRVREREPISNALALGTPIFRRVFPGPIGLLGNQLLLSSSKVLDAARQLERTGEVQQVGDRLYSKRILETQKQAQVPAGSA